MTSFLLINQGEHSNNYAKHASTGSVASKTDRSDSEKIEIPFRLGQRTSIMSSSTVHKNMFSKFNQEDDSAYESDGEYSVYSDADLDDVTNEGDRYNDERTEEQILEDKIENAEAVDTARFSLEHQGKIRPARKSVSHAEQDAWLAAVLNAERFEGMKVRAVRTIEVWWRLCLDRRAAKQALKWHNIKTNELGHWKMMRRDTRGLKQLSPLLPFSDEYAEMTHKKTLHSNIKAGIIDRTRMIKVKADRIKAAETATLAGRKAGKARAVARQGMNKRTEWHKARNANALSIAVATSTSSAEGQGKRAQRKIRQEKDRKEATAYAERMGPVVVKTVEIFPVVEMTDEERAVEKAEMDEAMARINRCCIEVTSSREKREAEEKKAIEEEKKMIAEEKAADAEFVTVMTRNAKPKKKITIQLGFKGLKEQVIDRRKATDEKYSKRCDGFSDLADKEKMAKALTFTALCKSVTSGKKCYHTNCRFAHSLKDLKERDCRFGMGCRFVRKMENGQYVNAKFGRTGKTCSCMHPGEHKRGFCRRMNLTYIDTSTPATVAPIEVAKVVAKTTSTPTSSVPIVSAWAKVVTKAETEEKMADARAKMTKAWSQVVVETLTADEKADMYGRGVTLLGTVDEKRDNTPIIPKTIRKPWDKRGLGFTEQKQTTTTKILVSVPGFSWVKGAVLAPPPEERMETVMEKVMAQVIKINKRIAAEMEKAEVIMMEKVKVAKAKAVEINIRLKKRARRKADRSDRKAGWKKVKGKKAVKPEEKKTELTVLRVPHADAELALLSALRNGLVNFRIEYTDEAPPSPHSEEEYHSETEREYTDEECGCGDCPDCGIPRPHMIGTWGYQAAMIGTRHR